MTLEADFRIFRLEVVILALVYTFPYSMRSPPMRSRKKGNSGRTECVCTAERRLRAEK